jgi:hypothetical protein
MGHVDGVAHGERNARMNKRDFYQHAAMISAAKSSHAALWFAPRVPQMPLPMQRYDDPFLPFGKAIIHATRDLVCAYIFDLAAYLALGAAGAVALERTIPLVNAGGDTLAVLHAPFASADYVEAVGQNAFNVDGVTISDERLLAPYMRVFGAGVFLFTDAPMQPFSTFSERDKRLTVTNGTPLHFMVLGDEVVYAGRDDDFAQQAREQILGMGT